MRHATELAFKIMRGRLPNTSETLRAIGPSRVYACGATILRDLALGLDEHFIDDDAFALIGEAVNRADPARKPIEYPDCPLCRVAIDHALEFPDSTPLFASAAVP